MYQSWKSGAALTAKLAVGLSSGEAVTATAVSVFPIGITVDSCNSGEGAAVAGCGEIAKLTFNDTLSAGALVGVVNGKGVAYVATTGVTYSLGIALESVAATGAVIPVLVHQMSTKIV